ncbi:MAG: sugar-binding protein [Propionibacteriaceae bacterium]|jgi:putative multiple sugar transport system substrate-binding protein|nr:sugar-binding protein [Propionibacteriaceae bacterium]
MAIRKSVAVLAGAAVALAAFAGCTPSPTPSASPNTESGSAAPAGDTLIGITMPTVSLERWNNDGKGLVDQLEKAGYKTMLDYGDNKNEQQIQQIENQINAGAKVLVIASIDGSTLGPTLAKAKEKGITVLAYDRLIMKTPDVDYYATFDNYLIGKLQGEFIKEKLDLDNAAGPFNFEPFAGSPDDNNASLFFQGAWDVLKPYVDSGKLVIQSETGKKAASNWQDIGILEWKATTAQSEMETRLNSYYTDKKVNVVLSPNDSLALGIAQALETKGYTPGPEYPVLSGQDGDKPNLKLILADKQSMTVWKDTRLLAAQVAKMVDQIVKGETVETNNTDTYNNGVKVLPSYLITPEVIVKDQIQEKLVGSGFVTEDDLK